MAKKKFALVGCSSRALSSYGEPLVKEYADTAELVGVFDTNYGRAAYVAKECEGVPVYKTYRELIDGAKPDAIIITTVDTYHWEYIVKGLEDGLQVFTEKPMCITPEQLTAILEAEKKYNNRIGVCFNDRYTSYFSHLHKMIPQWIGEVYTLTMEWLLARPKHASGHGASYYRRWNAYMALSGGLALTKATHHFDDCNWLIGQKPKRVFANGKLRVYGKNGPFRAVNCRSCPHTEECEFYTPISDSMQKLYVDHEHYDGYLIDRCAFDEAIDIYDNMTVSVEYDGGALMTYIESSAAAYEGFKITVNGEKGRLEIQNFSAGKGGLRPNETFDFVRQIDLDGNIITHSVPLSKGGDHDGSDKAFRDVLFGGKDPAIASQRACAIDGAYSVLIGMAANESIKTGKAINLSDLVDPALLEKDPTYDYSKVY